jgi:hypothetical protein
MLKLLIAMILEIIAKVTGYPKEEIYLGIDNCGCQCEVICIFVFSGILRYNLLITYNTFTLDNVYRSPSYMDLFY